MQKPIVNTFGHEFSMPKWFNPWQKYMSRLTPEGQVLASRRLNETRERESSYAHFKASLRTPQPQFDFMKELV